MEYIDFLKKKQKANIFSGLNVDKSQLNGNLFEWQSAVVEWALKKGRAGLFEDCGLGKSLQQLAWSDYVCKSTNGNVLILAPLAVSKQTKAEGEKFGIDVNICRTQADVKSGINITNYEMLEHFQTDAFTGVVLDESSILKSYMGKTKMQIIKAFENTEYKLTCTATPSPNNHLEILNQAEFLGVMRANEALAVWFINDSSQAGNYRLKKHAVKSFWEWVSTWAICISKPSDIGYDDSGYILPELNEITEIIPTAEYVAEGNISATTYHSVKKRTIDRRAKRVAEIVNGSTEQFVVWCDTNFEADELKRILPGAVEVRGSDSSEQKENAAMGFINGDFRVLISKPSMFGYGLNFQNCHNTVFCGRDYSYENYYQAVRRFWRFGQTNEVNVYSVVADVEKQILEAVNEKQELQNEMKDNMYSGLKQIQIKTISGHDFKLNLEDGKITLPEWVKGA